MPSSLFLITVYRDDSITAEEEQALAEEEQALAEGEHADIESRWIRPRHRPGFPYVMRPRDALYSALFLTWSI
jgi:hypothetical protein